MNLDNKQKQFIWNLLEKYEYINSIVSDCLSRILKSSFDMSDIGYVYSFLTKKECIEFDNIIGKEVEILCF